MGHFSETFRIKIDSENCTVKLSVKSADGRVDMHIIDVRDFNSATQEVSSGWAGCEAIKTKKVGKDVIVSISESEHKRIVYRFSNQEWRVLCEQFIGEIRSSGIEVQPYIVKEAAQEIEIPVHDIINAIQQTILPQFQTQISNLEERLKEQILGITSAGNMIQVTAVHDTSSGDNTPVFIPTNIINSNLEGNASVNTSESGGSSIEDALAALKKLKGDSQ